MPYRIRSSLFLIGLAAFASGCSSSQNAAALPLVGEAAGSSSARERIKIRVFSDLPTYPNCYVPEAIALGPDGALWATDDIDQDCGEAAVVRIAPAGRSTNTYYYQNAAYPSLVDITAGPDGALWIADFGDGQILRLSTNGTFTAFPVTELGEPSAIVAGPDRALWFVDISNVGPAVGKIETNGKMTTFTKGISAGAALQDIAAGPDGALWFTESTGDRIGRITTHGKINEYSQGITPGAEPYSIAPGPDGALWFTETTGGRIGRITTSGHVTEFSRGITPGEEPVDLAAGPDGAIWFTENKSYSYWHGTDGKIGKITTTGKITEYSKVDANATPTTIVQGPHGTIWLLESSADKTARIHF